MSLLRNASTDIPRQRLPKRKKDDEWKKKNVDAFYDISYFSSIPNSDHSLVEKAYDLYNGVIDDADYTHVLQPYGKKRQNFPAKLHNYPILKPIIDLLIGEKRKRPLNYSVVVENDDVTTKKSEEKKKQLEQAIQQVFIEELQKLGAVEGQQQEEAKPPKEVEQAFERDYRDHRAIQGQKALNIIEQELEVSRKFIRGWFDWLIAGKVASRRDVVSDELIYEILNPLHVDYDKSPEIEFIEDGDWAIVRKYAQPSEIVDEYYDVLTPEEIDQIEDPKLDRSGDYLIYQDFDESDEDHDKTRLIELVQVYWKSRKKIGFVDYVDQFGQVQTKQVEEDYEPNENDLDVEWHWVNEVWQGTRIDEDIYVDIGPHPIQRRDMDNPSKCKLPINGRKYSDRNAPNVSIMILGYPYQLMYNIFKFRLENAIAKSKDMIAQLDINMIPEGWDMDKFMYYIDATGIAWQDFQKEGIQPNPHQQQVLDLTMKTAEQYISLLEYTKQELYSLIGLNPQRRGQIAEHEKASNTEHAIMQSSHMTEDMFARFEEFEERDLQGLIDYSKWAWAEGKSANYVLPDSGQEIVEIDGMQHMESEYGVFVSNAREDVNKMQQVKQLSQAMLQNDVPLSDVLETIDADSVQTMKEKIKEAEKSRQELAKAQRQADMQQQLQEQELEYAKIKADLEEARMDNETKVQIEQMKQGQEIEENARERILKEEELDVERRNIESDERIARAQMQQNNSDE